MNYYLFDRATYNRLYNCSMFTTEEWELHKKPNVGVGVFYIALATFYQVSYIPFLIVMLKSEFIQNSCYKLMFFLGVIDVGATIAGGTICGILAIRGDIFCTNPDIVFITGGIGTTCWAGACCTGVILIFNRILDLLNSDYGKMFFGGKKTLIWLMLPIIYMYYVLFWTKPFMFTSYLNALFSVPYIGVKEIDVNWDLYSNSFVIGNNIVVATVFPILYTIMCVVLHIKIKQADTQISHVQKQLILQSILISVVLELAAIIYDYMQYFYVPPAMIVTAHFLWQASHGASVCSYIFVNRSMRRAVRDFFKKAVGGSVSSNHIRPMNIHLNASSGRL